MQMCTANVIWRNGNHLIDELAAITMKSLNCYWLTFVYALIILQIVNIMLYNNQSLSLISV